MQRLLVDNIENLKPSAGDALYQEKHILFEVLVYRYIEQFKQEEVAHQIGVSIRQLRREQEKAIETLAYRLIERYNLVEKNIPQENVVSSVEREIAAAPSVGTSLKELPQSGNWDWILNSRSQWVTNSRELILETIELIRPVVLNFQVNFIVQLPEILPHLAVHPVAFRQILLNLLRKSLDPGQGRDILIQCQAQVSSLVMKISVQCCPNQAVQAQPGEENNLLEIARELVTVSAGSLDIMTVEECWEAVLSLPVVDGLPVLIVDDSLWTNQINNGRTAL